MLRGVSLEPRCLPSLSSLRPLGTLPSRRKTRVMGLNVDLFEDKLDIEEDDSKYDIGKKEFLP